MWSSVQENEEKLECFERKMYGSVYNNDLNSSKEKQMEIHISCITSRDDVIS